jgi:hypothetical protein
MISTSLDTIEQEEHSCLRRVRRRSVRFAGSASGRKFIISHES